MKERNGGDGMVEGECGRCCVMGERADMYDSLRSILILWSNSDGFLFLALE